MLPSSTSPKQGSTFVCYLLHTGRTRVQIPARERIINSEFIRSITISHQLIVYSLLIWITSPRLTREEIKNSLYNGGIAIRWLRLGGWGNEVWIGMEFYIHYMPSFCDLLSLLVLHKALWNGSFMKSDKGVT